MFGKAAPPKRKSSDTNGWESEKVGRDIGLLAAAHDLGREVLPVLERVHVSGEPGAMLQYRPAAPPPAGIPRLLHPVAAGGFCSSRFPFAVDDRQSTTPYYNGGQQQTWWPPLPIPRFALILSARGKTL